MVFLWIYAIDVNLSRPPRASMGGCEQLLPASSDKPAKKLKASAGASDGRNMKSYEIPRYGYVMLCEISEIDLYGIILVVDLPYPSEKCEIQLG